MLPPTTQGREGKNIGLRRGEGIALTPGLAGHCCPSPLHPHILGKEGRVKAHGQQALTLACLSSSSANSMRFFRKEETRRDWKSMSSGEKQKGVRARVAVYCGVMPAFGLTLFCRVREALEALAAQLLVALCRLHLPVPSPSFVQCLVSIFVVSQCPKPPVQQVLRPSSAQDDCCHGFAASPPHGCHP